MLEWYYICGIIVYGIFIIQFLLSLFGIDLDLEVDDVISFKGLIHFCMGFFGWLCLKGGKELDPFDYLGAFLLGIGMMFLLYWIYKLLMKLEQHTETEDILGKVATVYLVYDNMIIVTVERNGQLVEEKVKAEKGKQYKKGDFVVISKKINNTYYIL